MSGSTGATPGNLLFAASTLIAPAAKAQDDVEPPLNVDSVVAALRSSDISEVATAANSRF